MVSHPDEIPRYRAGLDCDNADVVTLGATMIPQRRAVANTAADLLIGRSISDPAASRPGRCLLDTCTTRRRTPQIDVLAAPTITGHSHGFSPPEGPAGPLHCPE